MRQMENLFLIGLETSGLDGQIFGSLLDFVALLSMVLWSLVILTAVIRFVGIRIFKRAASRSALDALGTLSPIEVPAVRESAQTQLVSHHSVEVEVIPRRFEPSTHALVDASVMV